MSRQTTLSRLRKKTQYSYTGVRNDRKRKALKRVLDTECQQPYLGSQPTVLKTKLLVRNHIYEILEHAKCHSGILNIISIKLLR